jgi:hypothetical protein
VGSVERDTVIAQMDRGMKSPAKSSQQIRRFAKAEQKELSGEVRKWKKLRNIA